MMDSDGVSDLHITEESLKTWKVAAFEVVGHSFIPGPLEITMRGIGPYYYLKRNAGSNRRAFTKIPSCSWGCFRNFGYNDFGNSKWPNAKHQHRRQTERVFATKTKGLKLKQTRLCSRRGTAASDRRLAASPIGSEADDLFPFASRSLKHTHSQFFSGKYCTRLGLRLFRESMKTGGCTFMAIFAGLYMHIYIYRQRDRCVSLV